VRDSKDATASDFDAALAGAAPAARMSAEQLRTRINGAMTWPGPSAIDERESAASSGRRPESESAATAAIPRSDTMTNEKKADHKKHDKKSDDKHKAGDQSRKAGMTPAQPGKPSNPAKK
jgi:hypothetical protein